MSRWLFLRGLGVVYLCAFVSAWVQIHGLVGSRGVWPVEESLVRWSREVQGVELYTSFPTLCWVDCTDRALTWHCAAGAAFACLLIVGVAPVLMLACLWALYLSLSVAGDLFFQYQWDTLLVETGFLAIFFAPAQIWWRPSTERAPSVIVRWLYWWLLFRLIFGSGISKMLSGDPTWRDLTALQFHYQTQPLPPWTAWYAHRLAGSFQSFCVFLTLVIELVGPLLIFGPRSCRKVAFVAFLLLQGVIALTGNYGFFNLLSGVLCLLLLDDDAFPAWLRCRLGYAAPAARPAGRWPGAWAVPLACAIALASVPPFLSVQCRLRIPWPRPLVRAVGRVASFRSANLYQLFAIMTQQRLEIVLQGTDEPFNAEGVYHWQEYEFRWKPSDPQRRPRFCIPHLPRLDWQMWFAALGTPQQNPWVTRLLQRLVEGSPDVVELLGSNPFPDRPPRSARAVLYAYQFSDPAQRRQTGVWWVRHWEGAYHRAVSADSLPPFSLPAPDPSESGGRGNPAPELKVARP